MKSDREFAAIFDLDGTLIDTAGDLAAALNVALVAAGLDRVSTNKVRHLVGFGARRMLAQGYHLSAGREALEEELDGGLEIILDHYADNIAVHSRPFEGAVELIKELRENNWGIAICTNKSEALARKLVHALEIDALFDIIVGADTTEAAKPNPAPVRHCINALEVEKGIFIGDSDTDVRAAIAVNMPCLIAEFGYGPFTLDDQADGFTDYAEAREILRKQFRI